jgi:hypothetical protein
MTHAELEALTKSIAPVIVKKIRDEIAAALEPLRARIDAIERARKERS